ncbi:hypothetical protein H4219_002300 [Mycoemilia scoparia]|uniref:Uncharacterized protein n=1 Tax=Mycoemilia scoparia TaxID=417184 RepID=A0A9W8A2V9_9FUNG|nr:hypothetical protein H4219_002300 [Mycoemilia scoparia]
MSDDDLPYLRYESRAARHMDRFGRGGPNGGLPPDHPATISFAQNMQRLRDEGNLDDEVDDDMFLLDEEVDQHARDYRKKSEQLANSPLNQDTFNGYHDYDNDKNDYHDGDDEEYQADQPNASAYQPPGSIPINLPPEGHPYNSFTDYMKIDRDRYRKRDDQPTHAGTYSQVYIPPHEWVIEQEANRPFESIIGSKYEEYDDRFIKPPPM